MRYSTYFTAAQAGQIATSSSRDTITMPNDIAPLDFGVPVTIKNTTTIGSNPVVIKGGSEDDIIGVSIFKQPTESITSGSMVAYQYKPNEPVGIITDGSIYVIASVDVSSFDNAYVDVDGNFTNISTDNVQFGRFMTRAKAGEIAVLEFDMYTYNITYNITNNPIITPSGELILPSHDETYEDTAGETGEVFYDTTNTDIKAFIGGEWHTITTDKDDIIALDHTNALTTPGIIYYNNNHLRTHDYNTNTQTIVTTPDENGELVVKSHNNDIGVPPTPGLIYYDIGDHAFMGYTDSTMGGAISKKRYLGPKPSISYADTTLSNTGDESKYETILLEDKAWTPLLAYNLPAGPGRIINNKNFLFTTLSNGGHGNGFIYTGNDSILSTITVSISGYTTSSNDTTIEFEARNYNGSTIPGSRVSMNLADNDREATVTMIFHMTLVTQDSFNIYARHTSSETSIPFYTTNFSASSVTF